MATITADAPALHGPHPLPVLGWRFNYLDFTRDPISYLDRVYRTYGKLATMAEGTQDYIFVFEPEYLRQILSDQMLFYNLTLADWPISIQFPQNTSFDRLMDGLLTMNGEKHKQQRKLMMPAFHKKQIEGYHDTMLDLIERHTANWKIGEQIDIITEMQQLTLTVAMKILFGLDANERGESIRAMLQRLISPSIFTVLLPFDLPGLPYHRMLETASTIEREVLALIAEKRANDGAHNDVLSTLMHVHDEDGSRLTDAELIGQTFVLLVAGHETTASALAWTLFLLAEHPHVMSALFDELDSTLHGNPPTVEQVGELALLDRVIKESLRILPPVIFSGRKNTADVDLGPYHLHAGTRMLYSPFIMHRISETFPQPKRFQPDRWLQIDPSLFQYLPFGAGPRMCIGYMFAMMEMKLILSTLLQRYRFSLVPGSSIDRGFRAEFLSPKHLPALLCKQDHHFLKSEIRGNILDLVDLN